MTTSIDKVINLLTDMMDLTKLEGGRVRLNKGISSLGTTVQNITQEFNVPIQSSNITLDFYAEPDLPTLEYDSEKIGQVLKNFMSNALSHTPHQGAIVVQVRKVALVLEEGQQPTEHVMVSVFNSGKGIPPEELPLIFDRYRDLVSGKSSQNKTSGLGLVISQRIIEAHNGKIWAESEIGKGVTFHFALPLR
jgi:two-component system sensor histidine kinase ResE